MKLFQIEEPEGAPLSAQGPGAIVGIDLAEESGAVAIAVGGNAEILPGIDGERRLRREDVLAAFLMRLRGRAEKQLQRPVTHAVIAVDAASDDVRALIERAARAAGLEPLQIIARSAAAAHAARAEPEDRAALGAAVIAEDLTPPSV
jgi:molecular chaperone DnaK (HSP70)